MCIEAEEDRITIDEQGLLIVEVGGCMNDKAFDLEDRLVDFAVRVIGVVEALPDTKAGRHVAGQLVRCGTSPAPNYGEAQAAESRKDFIHKMKVCLKELRESMIWLKIVFRKPLCAPDRLESIMKECDELIAIFVSSTKTALENQAGEAAD